MSGDLLALASRRVLSDRTEPRSPIKPSRSSSRRKRTIRPKPVTRTQNKAYPSPLNHLRRSSTPPVLGFLHRSHILKSGERRRRAASLSHRKQRGYGRRIAAAGLGSFVRRTKPPRGPVPSGLCSFVRPRIHAQGLRYSSWVRFFNSRIRLAFFARTAVWVRFFNRKPISRGRANQAVTGQPAGL
jgi:hypothetical protein